MALNFEQFAADTLGRTLASNAALIQSVSLDPGRRSATASLHIDERKWKKALTDAVVFDRQDDVALLLSLVARATRPLLTRFCHPFSESFEHPVFAAAVACRAQCLRLLAPFYAANGLRLKSGSLTYYSEIHDGIRLMRSTQRLQGCDPLMIAAWGGHSDCVAELLPTHDLSARDSNGLSALDIAAKHGRAECVEILLTRFDPTVRGKNLATPLMMAAWSDALAQMPGLLLHSDPQARDLDGRKALSVAVQFGNLAAIEALLPLTDLTALDANGNNFLHTLALAPVLGWHEMSSKEISVDGLALFLKSVPFLLDQANRQGFRPMELLWAQGHFNVMETLAREASIQTLGFFTRELPLASSRGLTGPGLWGGNDALWRQIEAIALEKEIEASRARAPHSQSSGQEDDRSARSPRRI